MVCVGDSPRRRKALLSEHVYFVRAETMVMADHATEKRLQGRSDQRNMAIAGALQKPLGKQIETARSNNDTMSLLQVRLQLFEPGLEKDRLGSGKDGLNMLLRQGVQARGRPTKCCHPDGKTYGPFASSSK